MAVVKHRNGNYCLLVALTDGYMPLIELTPEEEATFRSRHADEQTRQNFLMSIAMLHLTRRDAEDLSISKLSRFKNYIIAKCMLLA